MIPDPPKENGRNADSAARASALREAAKLLDSGLSKDEVIEALFNRGVPAEVIVPSVELISGTHRTAITRNANKAVSALGEERRSLSGSVRRKGARKWGWGFWLAASVAVLVGAAISVLLVYPLLPNSAREWFARNQIRWTPPIIHSR
jgi:hypothetical protein